MAAGLEGTGQRDRVWAPHHALVAVEALHGAGAEAEQPGRGPGEEVARGLVAEGEGVHERDGPGRARAPPPPPGQRALRGGQARRAVRRRVLHPTASASLLRVGIGYS